MNNTRNKYVYLLCALKSKVEQVIYVFFNLNKVWGAGAGKYKHLCDSTETQPTAED